MQPFTTYSSRTGLALTMVLAVGQVNAGDDVFGTPAEPGDDLFGGASLVTDVIANEVNLAEDMLTGDEVLNWSGSFAWQSAGILIDQPTVEHDPQVQSELSGNLKLDARPNVDYRVLLNLDYSATADGSSSLLREAFADFDLDNQLFIRAGQQTLQWGVGYFYSPADTLSQDSIDANDPDQDRIGTMAAKIHKPKGTANYYAYLLPDDTANSYSIAVKGEWLLGSQEWGLGVVRQANNELNLVVTGSVPTDLGDLFTEYNLSLGETSLGLSAAGSLYDRSDELLQQFTVGMRASQDIGPDSSLSLSGQYYYNGLGYTEPTWSTAANDWQSLTLGREVAEQLSQQLAALMIQLADPYGLPLSASMLALSSLTDGSAMLKSTVTLSPNDFVSTALSVTTLMGDPGGEYAPMGDLSRYELTLTLGSQSF